jgi:hypothetical protein
MSIAGICNRAGVPIAGIGGVATTTGLLAGAGTARSRDVTFVGFVVIGMVVLSRCCPGETRGAGVDVDEEFRVCEVGVLDMVRPESGVGPTVDSGARLEAWASCTATPWSIGRKAGS